LLTIGLNDPANILGALNDDAPIVIGVSLAVDYLDVF
jgi:hypothetical protein